MTAIITAATVVDTRWFQTRLADRKLSQRSLAKVLGLDPAAVSLMLRGKRKMTAEEAVEVSRVLGVDVEEVLRHAGISLGTIAAVKGGPRSIEPPAPPAPPAADAGRMLEIPVPLANGEVAVLRLPHRLGAADAERIAALVRAFASPE